MALLSYGPQKYLDAQFALIWPAVITGQIAAVALIVLAGSAALGHGQNPVPRNIGTGLAHTHRQYAAEVGVGPAGFLVPLIEGGLDRCHVLL